MPKHERPQPEAGGAVEGRWHDHSTERSTTPQDSEPAGPAPEAVRAGIVAIVRAAAGK